MLLENELRNERLGQVSFDDGGEPPSGPWGSAPTWVLLCSGVPGLLTAVGQDEAATLLGVTSGLVRDIDAENVVSHEAKHIHVAHVLGMCGVVGGPVEAAGGDLVLQFSIWVLPSRTEQPVMARGQRGSVHTARNFGAGRDLRGGWGVGSPGPPMLSQGRCCLPGSSPDGLCLGLACMPPRNEELTISHKAATLNFGNLGHSCLD